MTATLHRALTALRTLASGWRSPRTHPTASDDSATQPDVIDADARAWLTAHQDEVTATSPATTLIHADHDVQQWMAATLRDLGWQAHEPVMLSTGWVPARGHAPTQTAPSGQPFVTVTTPSKTKAFARGSDPATSKAAGAAAAARQAITVSSHQGRLLLAYATHHAAKPGQGMTAAEAVIAAGLSTDGATGSPWHRVTDLRDMGLVTPLLDGTSGRTRRRNDSGSDADVMALTTLGIRAAAALARLNAAGHLDEPLIFDGYVAPTLFGQDAQHLATVDAAA